MSLVSLRIAHVRCIEAAGLELNPHRNFVFGPNGAGKTSLLEAVHVLGRGRSFRIRTNAGLIERGAEEFQVRGRLGSEGRAERRLAVRFGRADGLDVAIDGVHGRRTSELAALLPVHVLEPGMHSLIGEGPSQRRRFLDWGVFHVEPAYLDAWRDYRRALGQRNAALKAGGRGQGLAAWNAQLLATGRRVDAARARYVARWQPQAAAVARRLAGLEVTIEFDRGGYSGEGFGEALAASEARDRRIGVTHVGPHRADLRLKIGGGQVRDAASRGQQKLIAAALILAQVAEHVALRPDSGVLLVDDPAAELDAGALARLVVELERLQTQMLVTGIARGALEPLGDANVFHVEQGVVELQRV
jgi:DNA replication and repair protein RecF